jgi:hypothetical protein
MMDKRSLPNTYLGSVKAVSYLGNAIRYEIEFEGAEGGILKVDVHNPQGKPLFQEGDRILVEIPPESVRVVRGF